MHPSISAACDWAQASWSEKRPISSRSGPRAAKRTALGHLSCKKVSIHCSTVGTAWLGMSPHHDLITRQRRTGSRRHGAWPEACTANAAAGEEKERSCSKARWGFSWGWQRLSSDKKASLRATASKASLAVSGRSSSSRMRFAMCCTKGASSGSWAKARTKCSPAWRKSVAPPGPRSWSSGSLSQSRTSSAGNRSAAAQPSSQRPPTPKRRTNSPNWAWHELAASTAAP
mmetsp:Transcript_7539/g.20662  ORF Transcript_7539/g.20662 Transcript_7539/m.20662 type:complete len:229 (-) Transcript_7539:1121-1807(-)